MVQISIRTKRTGPRSTRGQIYKYIHNKLIRLWKESVAEFVRVAAQEVAIDTGMSKASLEPLAANIGLASALAESARGMGAAPARGSFDLEGNWHPDRMRSKAAGRREGKKAYRLTFGTPVRPEMIFTFKIVVWQYKIHELGMFGNDPWNSLGKGRDAFLGYFNREYPKIADAPLYDLLGRIQ